MNNANLPWGWGGGRQKKKAEEKDGKKNRKKKGEKKDEKKMDYFHHSLATAREQWKAEVGLPLLPWDLNHKRSPQRKKAKSRNGSEA